MEDPVPAGQLLQEGRVGPGREPRDEVLRVEAAAGAGSEALAQASRAASAAIEAVTDAGAAAASYEVAANATIAADGWVAGTATAERIAAVNAASVSPSAAVKWVCEVEEWDGDVEDVPHVARFDTLDAKLAKFLKENVAP